MATQNPFTSAKAPPSQDMKMALIAPELAGQQMSVGRLQQLAALLQQKALKDQEDSGKTQVIGGWAIPNSKMAGLSNILSGLGGAFLQNKADKDNAALMKAYAEKLKTSAFGGGPTAAPTAPNTQATQQATGPSDAEISGIPGLADLPQQVPTSVAPPQGGDAFNLQNSLRAMALGEFNPNMADEFAKSIAPTQMQRENQYLGIDQPTARQLQLAKGIKEGTQNFQPGQLNILPNGQRIVAPDFKEGIAGGFDAQGNPLVSQIPGATQAAASRAGAVSSAQEGVKPTTITLPDGRTIYTTVGAALGQNQPAGVQPTGAAPIGNQQAFSQQYLPAAIKAGERLGVDPKIILGQWGLETGWGKSVIPGTNNLGNIKGATGVPATDNATGSRDNYKAFKTPEEFADHYADMIQRKYPNAVGAGSDASKFTSGIRGYAEDPKYAQKVTSAAGSLGGLEVQSGAGKVFTEADAKQQVDFAGKYEEGMSNNLKKSGELMQRLNLTEQALKEFKSGGGTEARAKVAQMAQTLGLPQATIDKIAGGDLGAMQVVNKTALTESLLQMQHDLASDTGAAQKSNQMIMEKFMEANPHLDTDPRAWEKLLNLQKDIYTGKLSEANDYWKYKQENKGDTRQFPTYWANKKAPSLNPTKTNNAPYASQVSKSKPFSGQMTKQQWDMMKSGDTFIDAQGNTRRKP